MAYTRTYTARMLLEPGDDLEQLRWLQREAFENRAKADVLRIIDYTERQIPIEDLPPAAGKDLPRPLTDYECYEFVGVAEVDQELLATFTAPAEAATDA